LNKLSIFLRAMNNAVNERIGLFFQRWINKIASMVLRNSDLITAAQAAISSAKYEKEHLLNTPDFKSREKFFSFCLDKVKNDGLHLEFGTYKGDSINIFAKLCPNVYFIGFDSFEGLPETWGVGSQKGAFSIDGKLPAVRSNVRLVKGFYDSSLPLFLEGINEDEKVTFLHMDSDIYSSTIFVLNALKDKIVPGTIIVFDDFLNYWGWEEHDFKALTEFINESEFSFEWIAQMRYTGRVAIKILEN